jgi:ubiquinone/menaquinone biosynthesis C-methylase UbiE
MSERYLHIGCGEVILPKPFENLDTRNIEGVDHISEAYPLPFQDSVFDLVYASHVLEHFKRTETQSIVNEWVRVLKPTGIIRLSVPSLENLIKIYEKSEDIEYILGPLVGGQTYDQNFHYNMFDKKSLTRYLENAGCEAIHPWDFRRTSHSKFFDFSQATTWEIPISLNLEARKKLNYD